MKTTLFTAILSACMVFPLIVPAQDPGPNADDGMSGNRREGFKHAAGNHNRGQGGMNGTSLARELGLTDEQRTQLREHMFEMRKEMIQLRAERDEAKLEYEHLMSADVPNEEEVLASVEKLGDINVELAKLRVRSRLAMNKILTPEQLEKYNELREKMQQRLRSRSSQQRNSRSFGGQNQGWNRGGNMGPHGHGNQAGAPGHNQPPPPPPNSGDQGDDILGDDTLIE